MRISDWSSDVCSSDLVIFVHRHRHHRLRSRRGAIIGVARGCAVPLTASGRPVRKDAFDKTWRRRNPLLLLIATPWHVSKALMARAGAQETENAPSAVRPDKRRPRRKGGQTYCRSFNSNYIPPDRKGAWGGQMWLVRE